MGVMLVGLFAVIRVFTVAGERVALHKLGGENQRALETMGIGFGGAALILWAVAVSNGTVHVIHAALFEGLLYAVAFGLYTLAFVRGPISLVSPWSNATVVLLWVFHPVLKPIALLGLALFVVGSILLIGRQISAPVIWMLVSDLLLALGRIFDVHHVGQPPVAYAACLFTGISLWMFVVILFRGRFRSMLRLAVLEKGWSFVAASANAAAYLSLFILLRWLHPAAVEAISAFASTVAVLAGIYIFREPQGKRKIISSLLMTGGTIALLYV